jgi:hypothetical protein
VIVLLSLAGVVVCCALLLSGVDNAASAITDAHVMIRIIIPSTHRDAGSRPDIAPPTIETRS